MTKAAFSDSSSIPAPAYGPAGYPSGSGMRLL